MIARTQASRVKLRAAVRHAVVVVGIVFLLGAGGLCAQIVLRNREAARLEQQNLLLKRQIASVQSEVDRAKHYVERFTPTDLSAVAKFQSKLEKMAADQKCTVIEFRASSEVTPYLTRFSKATNVAGWGQVNAQFSLSGTPKNVSATLVRLIDAQIPFEFDSMEYTREKTNSLGEATIIGHATMRVLIRTSKETA